ncbi:MAG TPA: CRISPR-associated protein Cas4 [bacterium]|nr:CRISPR-associated protein Cas4 [bacterium]
MIEPAAFTVNASELRQYVFCPRILFFRYVMPVDPPMTYSMKRGISLQERFEILEPRRTLKKYGLETAERRFRFHATAENIHLAGEIDLLLETRDRCAVVEFKAGDTPAWRGHYLQLAAYSLLAQSVFDIPCNDGFLCYQDQKKIEHVKFTESIFADVKKIILEIRMCVETQLMPPRPEKNRKCVSCEYRNFCGDVF